jgi:uncharacterized protein YlxW (UPF0749 family)
VTSSQPHANLLAALVLDPRDPGYEAAAARRGGAAPKRWYDRPIAVIGLFAVGFTLAVSYAHTNRSAPEAAKVHTDLVNRVRSAEHLDTSLTGTVNKLNSQLNALRATALSGSSSLARDLSLDELVAGQTAVQGPGLEVDLSEPKIAAPTDANGTGRVPGNATTNVLSDRDVRSVVNQLWADDAEAISVNGVRLTPTSAVRFAGDAVLVDYQPISSPYSITAIGNADSLATGFASSDVASRYQTLASAKGIGFSFAEHSKLKMPASVGLVPRYASVPTTSTSTTPSTGVHK